MDDVDLDLDSAIRRGFEQISRKQWKEGFQLLREVVDGRYGRPDDEMLLHVYRRLIDSYADAGEWAEMLGATEKALQQFPDDADTHRRAGEASYFLGRREKARAAFERALELEPGMAEARSSLALLRDSAEPGVAPRVRPWPKRQTDFGDPRSLIQKYLLRGRPADRFITEQTVFFTLGSCFAGNLAKQLKARGYRAHFESVSEEVNSTFANRSLLEWIEKGVVDEPTEVMDQIYGPEMRESFRKRLRHCGVFVMTLGVAASFFREDTGAFAFAPLKTHMESASLYGRARMRTTTVAENVENITAIIAALDRLTKGSPRVVLTVSPVPLAGTSEQYSAITADALSKSTLRVACEEVVNAQAAKGVVYWPSFEMVRWLGAHYGADHAAYASADGSSRHVSEWLIDLIIDLFLESHSVR